MFDRLVRMQHYDLPTRLLDVTLNPLVALFFAVQDYADETEKDGKILKTPRDGKVIVYRAPEDRSKFFDSEHGSLKLDVTEQGFQRITDRTGQPLPSNLRPIAQAGAFILYRPKNNNRRITPSFY